MKAHRRRRVITPPILNLGTIYESEISASLPNRFTARRKPPGFLCLGGRAGSGVSLDVSERRKTFYRSGEMNHRSSSRTIPAAAALQI